MAYYTAMILGVIALTCRGTNTTWNQTSANRPASASSTHRAIGDFVAAGLDMSREMSSILTSNTTSIFTSDSTPLNQAQSKTKSPTTAITVRDCWHSWLAYWDTSAVNQLTSTDEAIEGGLTTTTDTITRFAQTSWTTTEWVSYVYTRTLTILVTVSSDGFPVSVYTSYDVSSFSSAGWEVKPLVSFLSQITTTSTITETWHSYIAVTRSATSLPTPICELPSAVPECSMQWSSYVHGNYRASTPYCTQAQITGDLCASLRSYWVAPWTTWGQTEDIGWATANGTSYFPASLRLAPGCSLGCQACSITGNSVQLYYWPPSTATLVENGTETATLTHFAQDDSGMRTVSIDGTTLTSPTVYLSYDTLYASNSCGAIGNTYKNVILPLQNTNHLFSLDFFVPYRGASSGYETRSFNFSDLVAPVADAVYNRQSRCRTSWRNWVYLTWDKVRSGEFSCTRISPYAPTIAVPPEVRALDPAWEPCGAWYGGLFDPPKALQPANATTPKPTVDSGLPTETPAPVTDKPKTQAEQSEHAIDSTPVDHESKAEGATQVSDDTPDAGGTKESELDSDHDLAAGADPTRPGTLSTDHAQDPVATSPHAKTQLDSSEGVAAILSMLLTGGTRNTGTESDSTAQVTQASDPDSHDSQGAAATNRVVRIDEEGLTIGAVAALNDATIPPKGRQTADPDTTTSANTVVAGETMAALKDGFDVLVVDATKLTLDQVATVAGTRISVVSEGIVAGSSTASFQKTDSSTTEPHDDAVAADGTTHSASELRGQSETVLLAGQTLSTGEDAVSIDGEVYPASSLPGQPNAVLLAGYTLSQGGPAATINGQVVTRGPHGLSVLAPAISVTSALASDLAHSVVTIDGTAYTATPVQGGSGVVVLDSQTLSIGGPGIKVGNHIVTRGSNGISLVELTTSASSASHPTLTTTDMAKSYTVAVPQTSAEPDESSGSSKVAHGSDFLVLAVAMILVILIKL